MRLIGGIGAGILAALVVFHAPDGSPIALDPANGQLIIRRAPPGYAGRTMIETGVGIIVVTESFCDVSHALNRVCGYEKKTVDKPVPGR